MHRSAPPWFERLAFVLVRPSHPGNVGAVARAMRTMGLRRLILVDPREPDVLAHPEAVARASGAHDVLAQARVAATLDEALAPFTLAVAVSAEAREFGPQPRPPEAIAVDARAALLDTPDAQVALVFGPERTGLSIEDAARCQLMCSIPGEPDYNSLNLAQAAQIVAYCLRSLDRLQPLATSTGEPGEGPGEGLAEGGRPATIQAVEGFFGHLQEVLIRIGFLDPAHPKRLMPRLRRLFGRARLEDEEVAILRGVCTQILKLADGDIHGPSRSRAVAGQGHQEPAPAGPGKPAERA
ncbi:RNA methyltransferase [Zeimonas arvi]|uniref:RNA methyltransferase n=1 Tax=Zeimonas arvi TaxID=2498847 RepID=UPI001CEC09F9|nr:RNA methyltransferase [Zeimonas arvi]